MVGCVLGSKEVFKYSSCYHTSLICIINVLSKIQQLAGAEFVKFDTCLFPD